jgi:hypothetical protein
MVISALSARELGAGTASPASMRREIDGGGS